ncbi:MAG: hypothetical protein QOI34_1503 [Verrucomicrobiota bacterium]|jgi:hypothetical protein
MSDTDSKINRLLRSAGKVTPEQPSSPPFGFETRVVALWRSGRYETGGNGIAALIRRAAMVAAAVIVISGAAAIREFAQTRESLGEPSTNEFAFADSAIQSELSR